jgi:tripartite-type tricarboxylate transporter receptor subunit TctC
VRWVVPFAPSGPTDIMSRAVAEKLSQRLGQPFVVDNRPGAGGSIGAEVVSKAAPDGYTLMIGHVGTHAINSALYPKIAFDPVRDFTPITLIATLPLALVVNAGLPFKDAKQLIAHAKAHPGQLNFASAGNGGPTHLTGELLKSSAGIDIVHVPYKGNAAALTDLIAGRVQMMFSNMLTSMRTCARGSSVRSGSRVRNVPHRRPIFRRSPSRACPGSPPSPGMACWAPPRCRRRSSRS